ncbi:hypothetical protein [Pseudomonas sp. 5P_5.1_Bac1]|uniref:hypothetical protein n=1 Tax=Pseudomonas sp. 5P_5.1_Bac1 TaxID=2971616 RepID=UPI0039659A44
MRREFANWASRNWWDTKALMEYVGWGDVQSAARYIEAIIRLVHGGREALSPFTLRPLPVATDGREVIDNMVDVAHFF